MPGGSRAPFRLVRPGEALIVTTWGPGVFEPAATIFWRSIARFRPELRQPRHPWDRISDRSALHDLLIESGAPTVQVVEERGEHVLESPEDWWRMVLGSGLRGAVERLTDVERERVRRDNIDCIAAAGIRGVRVDTVYGIARKH